jgi:NAD(P)-dependent dehydrogenase (short-subunit alcohol dehydrogenase family)
MGAEEARLFAAEGARLVLTDVNELAVQSVARDLEPNVRLWSDRLRPPVGTLGAP